MTIFHALPSASRIEQESIIGLHSTSPEALLRNVDLPSVSGNLGRDRLCIGPIQAAAISAKRAMTASRAELKQLFGGIFKNNLSPWMTAHASLLTSAQIQAYNRPGLNLKPDLPQSAYTFFECGWEDWTLCGLGDPSKFQTVFLGREISPDEALDANGQVSRAMLPTLRQIFQTAFPKIDLSKCQDHSADFEANQWLGYWKSDGLTIKIGIRALVKDELALMPRYFAGIRVNWVADFKVGLGD